MVVIYKNMVGLDGLARWVTLQHYFGTTLLKGCRPLPYIKELRHPAHRHGVSCDSSSINKKKKRWESQYDAAPSSSIQKLYRHSRTWTAKEVTEAETTFCKILAELFGHFSRAFQQGQPVDLAMPTALPPRTDSHTADQNPFTGEFTPEEVWTRLHRCRNTAPGSDGMAFVDFMAPASKKYK